MALPALERAIMARAWRQNRLEGMGLEELASEYENWKRVLANRAAGGYDFEQGEVVDLGEVAALLTCEQDPSLKIVLLAARPKMENPPVKLYQFWNTLDGEWHFELLGRQNEITGDYDCVVSITDPVGRGSTRQYFDICDDRLVIGLPENTKVSWYIDVPEWERDNTDVEFQKRFLVTTGWWKNTR